MISIKLLVLLFGLGSCDISREEFAAQSYIDLVQAEYVRQYDNLKNILWDNKHEMNVEEILYKLDVLGQSQNFSQNVANTLAVYDVDHFENENLKRSIKLLKDIRTLNLPFPDFATLSGSIETMKNFTTARVICTYENRETCNMALLPGIRGRFKQSQDPAELQYYWQAWRDHMGPMMMENLQTYLDMYRQSAVANHYRKPSEQWYSKYENPRFMADMTDVMEELKPIYVQLHAYIRRILRQKYGDNMISQQGAVPQHLMDQTLVQAWDKKSILKDPYPDKKLPNMKQHLDDQEFTSFKMVELGDDFFKSLGFEELPRTFWSDYVKMIPNNQAGPDCKSEVFDFYTNVALKYCPKPTFKKFIQIHGDMAAVHNINQKRDLSFALRDEPCPGFSKALGEAAVLSCSTPKHIQGIRLLEQEYNYDDERSLNRIFRLGVHTLLQIPFYYIHEKIWTGLLDGEITLDNANCKYWDLMLDYMGVESPVDRSSRNLDLGYRFYEHLDERKPHAMKFVSEILGYQIYKGLCERSGQYIRGHRTLKLQNCDFFGYESAGNALKEIMKSGSKKPWHEIIAPLTGSSKLDARAILEFYEPLHQWLIDNNRRHNTPTGWRRTKNCFNY